MICDACGKSVLFANKFEDKIFCVGCAKTIGINTWINKEFFSNDEILKTKNDVVLSARNAAFPNEMINKISNYFDEQIEDGLILKIDGGEKQVIKVYDEYCTIFTSNNFDEENVSKRYARALKKGPSFDSLICEAGKVSSLTKGLVSNKTLISTGVSIAKSVAVHSAMNYLYPETIDLVVSPGKKKIYFEESVDVQLMKYNPDKDESIGCIKFSYDNTREELFFFSRQQNKIIEACGVINELISKAKEKVKTNEKGKAALIGTSTAADEIKKFKDLLDMGAITQEEYDLKKKQLLNL